MSAMYVGHNPGEVPSGRGATWVTLLFCVSPLSVLWCLGAYFALNVLPSAPASMVGGEGVLARIRFAVGPVLILGSGGIGLAALWSVLVSRSLRPNAPPNLRRWQLYGLRIGSLQALVFVIGSVATEPFTGRSVLHAAYFLWPVLVAWWLTRNAGRWLFIPWHAR